MKELITEMLEAKKSDSEIVNALLETDDAKSLDADAIVDKITLQRKAFEASAKLAQKSAEADAAVKAKEAKTEFEAKVSSEVEKQLKSINIQPTNKYNNNEKFTRFNAKTGSVEDIKNVDAYNHFANMLDAIVDGDKKSAKAISLETDQENVRKQKLAYKAIGQDQKVTPSVSDVVARGGYAIPTEVSDEIMQLTYSQSVMIPKMMQDNVIYNDKIYPLMYGIDVGYIADQSTAVTEKNPTFTNPTVNMERVGGFSTISNQFLKQKGANLVSAIVTAYGSAFARFFDLQIPCGNVNGASDLIDGIAFDPNTSTPTAFALSALTLAKLQDIKNTLDEDVDLSKTVWVANRKVADKIGSLEDGGSNLIFKDYVTQGAKAVSPYGIPLVENPYIPSVLDIGGDNRTGGTDDVLFCVDLSKVVLGIDQETRIETSEHFKFSEDLLTLRAIKRWGQKVLSASGTGGVVAVAQELTN